jgi:F-type H+-transporting ATPase subunit delta
MQKIARRALAAHIAKQLQAGDDTTSIVQHVAAYLVEQKQTHDVELLLRDVESLLESEFSVVVAKVTSARPLDDATRGNIRASLTAQTGAKHVIISEEIVDTTLIGGVVIETATSVFDSSIKTKLRSLKATTKE